MKNGHSFKDRIIPKNVKYNHDHFQYDNKYGRVLFISDLPNWLDTKFVSELCDVNKNLMYSMDIISIPRDEAIKEVQNKLLGVTTNITKWQQSQNRNNNWSAIIPPKKCSLEIPEINSEITIFLVKKPRKSMKTYHQYHKSR